jgi:hypothetical protein
MTEQRPQGQPILGKQTGVPRRFGVSVGLVIMTMYAALFAATRRLDPWLFTAIALFFTGVGLAQAVLFKGRNPRLASLIAGAVLLLLMSAAWSVVGIAIYRLGTFGIFVGLACALVASLLIGPVAGYLAGGLIAGVFFLLNKVQKPLEDEDAAQEAAKAALQEPTSPWSLPPGKDEPESP